MKVDDTPAAAPPPASQGRLYVLAAALLWSTSGAFTKILTRETAFHLNEPEVHALQIAFYRALFAGLFFVPFLRRTEFSFRPMMIPMVVSFAVMNTSFVAAMKLGTAANAILLQYTAPMWMYLGCVWLLGEASDRRSLLAFAIGLIGIAVIVVGGWDGDQLPGVQLGLLAGFTYAGIMLCLRVLKDASSRWLTTINHLFSAAVLIPFVWSMPLPTGPQMAVLVLFGIVQMAVPYYLVARGVQSISPQEAGTITLAEPLLNPVWALIVSGEQPHAYSIVGGAFILGGLAWRYWPRGGSDKNHGERRGHGEREESMMNDERRTENRE
jgi:drug/metabolite transporter (DMT)-like permease